MIMHELSDPRTGLVRRQVTPGGPGEVATAVAAARRALPRWAGLTPKERSHRLLALVATMEEHIDRYVGQ